MKVLKKIGDVLLVILCILSVFMTFYYLIYHNYIKSDTFSVHYFGFQTPTDLGQKVEDLSAEQIKEFEERTLFEVNVYSNAKENGKFMGELKLNYFMDYTLTTQVARSFGVQSLYDLNSLIEKFNNASDVFDFVSLAQECSNFENSLYYYEMYDGISWSGGNSKVDVSKSLSENEPFIISIDNTPYLIKLDGKYPVEEQQYFLGFIPTGTKSVYKPYSFFDLYYYLYECCRTNSGGFGDKYLVVDVSEFFTDIRAWNEDTKQFDRVPPVDISKKYSYLKIHYYEDGMVSANQSIFGSIAFDSSYGNVTDENVDFGQVKIVYELNESNLEFRYSDKYKGFLAYLPMDTRTLFEDIKRYKVNVVLDLDSSYLKKNNISLVGLDYSAFADFDVSKLVIHSSKIVDFYLLDSCFKNSNLKKIEYSENLNLVIDSSAINNDYEVAYV